MSEIQKIQRYVETKKVPDQIKYTATLQEICALARELSPIDAVALAFSYGKAKGYQAAKAEDKEAML